MALTVTKCTREKLALLPCQGRIIEAEFVKEEITSDGGVLFANQNVRIKVQILVIL